MNIFIDNKCGIPIYDQIYSQIKNHIISGELHEDDSLPSIRSLAKDLRISVITTKRAYDELEKKKIEEHINEILKLSVSCNLSIDDLIEMIKLQTEE